VPEDRHVRVGPFGLDQLGQQREMIVLDQDIRGFHVLDLFERRLREFLLTASYHCQSVARKMGRVCAMWQSGHNPSFENP